MRLEELEKDSAQQEAVWTDKANPVQTVEREGVEEDFERYEEEALRGVVERGERRGVLKEIAVKKQRATILYRSSAGATGSRRWRTRTADREF